MIPSSETKRETVVRGSDATSGSLFSYVDVEERIPATHPLRTIRSIVNDVLAGLDAEFEALYQGTRRQSIAPERLLRASLFNPSSRSRRRSQIERAIRTAASSAGMPRSTPIVSAGRIWRPGNVVIICFADQFMSKPCLTLPCAPAVLRPEFVAAA